MAGPKSIARSASGFLPDAANALTGAAAFAKFKPAAVPPGAQERVASFHFSAASSASAMPADAKPAGAAHQQAAKPARAVAGVKAVDNGTQAFRQGMEHLWDKHPAFRHLLLDELKAFGETGERNRAYVRKLLLSIVSGEPISWLGQARGAYFNPTTIADDETALSLFASASTFPFPPLKWPAGQAQLVSYANRVLAAKILAIIGEECCGLPDNWDESAAQEPQIHGPAHADTALATVEYVANLRAMEFGQILDAFISMRQRS